MPNGDLQRDIAPVAEAEKISFLYLEVIHERHGVIRRLLEAKRAVGHIAGTSVALLLECNDLPALCQGRQDLSKGGIDGRSAAVKQDQRGILAAINTVELVIHLEPVHWSVASVDLWRLLVRSD
jgi:hypothetical protein